MLDRKTFDKNMSILLTFKNVKSNDVANNFFYNLVKNDFTDTEFGDMCVDICKTEELYNKYPDPKMFYDRKQQSQKTILCEVGSLFVDDTFPQYRSVLEDLDQDTRDDVCNRVGQWLLENKRGEMVSEDFIVDRLKQFRPQKEQCDYPTLTEIKKLIAEHKGE